MVIATVKGDIHDIGKNIVKTVLENYGYDVIDLGRDVPPETIADTVREEAGIRLVGLSALMTTTLPRHGGDHSAAPQALPEPPITFVGGAVVTPEYAAENGRGLLRKGRPPERSEIAREVFGK